MIDYGKSAKINDMETEAFKSYIDKYPGSRKIIVSICDGCGKERTSEMGNYHALCGSCSQHKLWSDASMRDKQSEITTEYYKLHPEAGRAHSVKMKEYNRLHPEKAMQHSDDIKAYFSDPSHLIAHGKRMKQYYIDHHEAREAARLKSIEQWSDQDIIDKISGENSAHWKGGFDRTRSHLLPISMCSKLNKWFIGCNAHHITKSIVAFIPNELHDHIRHNLKTGSNMGEINAAAIQFINGGLEI